MDMLLKFTVLSLLVIFIVGHHEIQAGNYNSRSYPDPQFIERELELLPQESHHHYQKGYYHQPGHNNYGWNQNHNGQHNGYNGHRHHGHGHGHYRRPVHHVYHGQRRSRVLPLLLAGFAAGSALAVGAGIASGAIGK